MTDTLRNTDLATLAAMLKDQNNRKLDVIVPASKMRMENGTLIVDDAQVDITDEGVTARAAHLTPGKVFNEGVAQKLGIPQGYLSKMYEQRPDLYDANVNGWLHGEGGTAPDPRSFLVRAFAGGDYDYDGFARAFLSDTYKMIDNFDVLMAVLAGVQKAGVNVEIPKCDLTERKMYAKITAPEVQALAPALLKGYQSPFTGASGDENPLVFAGFIVSNSEVGGGAFTITPSMTIQVCNNGLTMTKDAMRSVHLGSKLEEGVIKWSEETQAKTLELITLKAADAVATFLDVDYMTAQINALTEKAGKPIEGSLPDVVKTVTKKLLVPEDQADGILDHFLRAGQFTAGGVMQAFTSYCQTLPNADDAYEMEELGVKALEVAAGL